MDKKRLQELAGIIVESGEFGELPPMAESERLELVAKDIFKLAESKAFDLAEPTKSAVTGDSVSEQADKLLEALRKLVHEEVIKEYA